MTYKQQVRYSAIVLVVGGAVLVWLLVAAHGAAPLKHVVNEPGGIQIVTTPDNYIPPAAQSVAADPQAQPTVVDNSTTDALQTGSGTNVDQPAAPAPEQPHTSPQATVPPNSTTTETTITFGGGDQ